MFQYNLLDKPNFHISEKTLDDIFIHISHIVSIPQQWTLNIVFLDDNSIQKLNNQYRKKDTSTDVLSFHYYEDFSTLENDEIAWEIILSENKIISQGVDYKLWSEKEFYKLIIHSTLHILGYDHEDDQDYQVMQPIEEKIWQEVFVK
jgi:probable rRNA maturation factor